MVSPGDVNHKKIKALCLNPDCAAKGVKAETRGLCHSCDTEARRLIKRGDITWDDLVAAGFALNCGYRDSGCQRRDWLLSAIKK
jgi:hypothetical protein